MVKRKSKIPEFKNYAEEANFWDTHSITDFEDETLVLRIQKDIKTKLERIARNIGLNVSTLARMWLIERLRISP